MSTFISGVPNPNIPKTPIPNIKPTKPKTKEELEAMVQQRRDDIKIKIPAFVDNLPSTDFHPILGEGITIAEVLGNKPPMRKPNKGTKFIIGATIEK
tara:strand:+ start:133 stop:423 length:291 start_codon:yes stop_codon:yes gene_type:complete